MVLVDSLPLLLLLAPNVIRLPSLERGDQGGSGSTWVGVHPVMVVLVFGVPIESRDVHAFQNICIFIKYYKG